MTSQDGRSPVAPGLRVYLTPDGESCYLVPVDVDLPHGELHVIGPGGATSDVDAQSIEAFAAGRSDARAVLRARWDEAVRVLQGTWSDLAWFAGETGSELRLDDLAAPVQRGIALAGDGAEDAFATAMAIVGSLADAPSTFPEGPGFDEAGALRSAFGRLPQLLGQFTDPALDAAASDPDAWARRLSMELFGDPSGGTAVRRRDELSREIQESIAQRLRDAGVQPSIDDAGTEVGPDHLDRMWVDEQPTKRRPSG